LKKPITILFLTVFAMSQIGHHLVFSLAKWNAKEIISQDLKLNIVNELVEKISDNKYIHWEEKNEEFELAGIMYDVVKKEVINNQLVYYCINDQKESGLIQLYNNWMQNEHSNEQGKQNAKSILKYTQIECDFPIQKVPFTAAYCIASKISAKSSDTIYRSLLVEGPPPKYFA
jgi:hypothetical protein